MAFATSPNHQSSIVWKRCNSLARGIDQALASNNVPASAPRIPLLVKQVYSHLKDTSLRPVIGLLMISVKNALNSGWFHGTDADELFKITNELLSSFCMDARISADANAAVNTISKIIFRFLPQLILNHLIICIEAKRGYDVLMADFYMEKAVSPKENIRLFVARNDDLLASSCLVSPSDASFLLNGKHVAGRINGFLDSGPQVPTDITELVRYGTNIIQAAGCFTDNYIIAVVSMSKSSATEVPNLKDYVQASVSEVVSDSEILEGPSRVSLNCPLSFKRISTPIKGHLCKHHQCFDCNNFLELNFKKPFWHCPICDQSVSFVDIRIDQTMVKILQDATPNINDVNIYPDGTWSITEAQTHNQVDNANSAANVFDLTAEEDSTSHDTNIDTEDEKPIVINDNGVSLNSITKNANSSAFDQELASTVSVLDMFQSGSLFEPPAISNENEMQQLYTERHEPCLNPMQTPISYQCTNMHQSQYRTSGYPCASYQSVSSLTQNRESQYLHLARQQEVNQLMNIWNSAPLSSSVPLNIPENSMTDIRRRWEDRQRVAQFGRALRSLPNDATNILGTEPVQRSETTNWQPSGRMRGSLTGNAYSAAVNRYSSQPPQ